ncbi:MAG: universal stress protein [Thiomonas sp.]
MDAPSTVLAATDLSACALHAVRRAALLARSSGASLDLVHVAARGALDDVRRWFGADAQVVDATARDNAVRALSQLRDAIAAEFGVAVDAHVLDGAVVASILRHADAIDAGLLVVGARGADSIRDWLLGATADRLLRSTLRPMLAVKQPPRAAYRQVVVAVDFSAWSCGALRLAQAMAPQARYTLLYADEALVEGKMRFAGVDEALIRAHRDTVRTQALAELGRLADGAAWPAAQWRAVVAHGDAAACILQQQQDEDADLLVLGKHGTGVTEELLFGSVTKHVLAHARCDVLIASGGAQLERAVS